MLNLLLLNRFFQDVDDVTLDAEVLSLVVQSGLQLIDQLLRVQCQFIVVSIERTSVVQDELYVRYEHLGSRILVFSCGGCGTEVERKR